MHIDLSVVLDNKTPAYPGDPTPSIQQTNAVSKNKYTDHLIMIGNHAGTHIDAPSHMINDGKHIGEFELDTFFGNAIAIDIRGDKFSLKTLESTLIPDSSIVLLFTGMGSKYYDPCYFTEYPVITEEMANYLVAKNIKMLGIDTCSIDGIDPTQSFPIHKIILGANIPIIENMSNLEKVIDRNFELFAMPINVLIDAAPVRPIAIIKG